MEAQLSSIMVSVLPPTEAGRLYPQYDDSAGILAVQSRIERPWLFGVDIDGRVVFDLDEQRVLANFDLHIPKSRWRRDRLEEEYPLTVPAGDLVFAVETIETKSFSLPLTIRTDVNTGHVRIEFAKHKPNRAVVLSSSCVALLSADELVGFEVWDLGRIF